jgi:hypothetical protein
MNAPAFLRIPLALIDYVDDIDAFEGLPADKVALFQRDYEPAEIQGIVDSLHFAADHPEFDFASMVPGSSKSNAQMHRFLLKILQSFEEAGLAPGR